MGKLLTPLMFERGDTYYFVTPIAPFEPAADEIEHFAFAKELQVAAPNPHIGWMRGQYVEADRPNRNNDQWRADDFALNSLTPMFMPVTVMHDPRTAVGLIADTRLVTPKLDPTVARARIDTSLAIWRHRFPETWEEAVANYSAGTLMQSMECKSTFYDCAECGLSFPKLPGGAEVANWCAHLKAEDGQKTARILRNVCFTGTGLIFGTRGARGAYTEAHLDVLQDEVAEFHEQSHREKPPRRVKRKGTMEIEDGRYQELLAAESRAKDLEPKVASLEEAAAKVPDLEKKVEEAEAKATKAETDAADEKKKREDLEETARADTLGAERMGKLGKDFVAKLGEFTKGNLEKQAKTMSDEDFVARLKELEEMAGVKSDAGGTEPDPAENGDVVAREAAARSAAGRQANNGGDGEETAPAARRSIVEGLLARNKPAAPAAKS